MLDYTKEDLQDLGAEITTREIYQQPKFGRKRLACTKKDKQKSKLS